MLNPQNGTLFFGGIAERTLSIKLPEFRKQIETYSIEELRYLTAELYKAIPKKIKEEKDIDPLVLSVPEHFKENGTGKASSPSKVKKAPDLGALESEIELFLENAYAQNYFAPNRFVPKHERPKWRFKVKNYIKTLRDHYTEGEEAETAALLLEKLYRMLCYGCCYYIFSTTDPFQSIGMRQNELLDLVIKKSFACGVTSERICKMEEISTLSGLSYDMLSGSLLSVLAANLKTADMKETAIAEAKKLRQKIVSIRYSDREQKNSLTTLILMIHFSLYEYEEGIRDFKEKYLEPDKEILYYVLLSHMFFYDLKNYWVREYKTALNQGISLRKSLMEIYEYLMEHEIGRAHV